MPAATSSMEELQKLSLVSKICTELDNHLGLSDRTLAEFIIHLAEEFPEPPAFRHALAENGAEFPDSLSDNLLRIIGAMKPASRGGGKAGAAGGGGGAKKAGPAAAARVPRNEKEARFPGLAMPNTSVVELEDGFGEVDPAAAERERKKKEVRERERRGGRGIAPNRRCISPVLQAARVQVVCRSTCFYFWAGGGRGGREARGEGY